MKKKQSGTRFWDHSVIRAVNFAADMVLLSILWAVCSLPVVTVGVAGAALYHTASKVLVENRGSIFSTFVQSVRDSWKQALPIGALLAGLSVVLLFVTQNILFSGLSEFRLLLTACVIALLHLCLMQIHLYPLIGQFTLTGRELLSLVIRLTSSHLLRNASLLGSFVAAAVAARVYPPLLLFILPAGFALLSINLQTPMFEKFIRSAPTPGLTKDDGEQSN